MEVLFQEYLSPSDFKEYPKVNTINIFTIYMITVLKYL